MNTDKIVIIGSGSISTPIFEEMKKSSKQFLNNQWCVKYPGGGFVKETIRDSQKASIQVYCDIVQEAWYIQEINGYTCIEVEVTIKEK